MATQTTKTALEKIKAKRTQEQDKIVKNDFAKNKKSNDWIWWYFPIPKSVLVKGLSDEKRTVPYALTDEDTMGFIKDQKLYKKYCDMVQDVDYATFFEESNKEDDKRKFKESIFHFLHFSIDLLIYYNKKKKNSNNLVSHTKTERGDVFTKTDDGELDELKKKAENLIKICFIKKKDIEKSEYTNLEYINEQWLHLEKQIYDITKKKIPYKEQVKKFGKEDRYTTGDGSCFFWAILQTISPNPTTIDSKQVEDLRRNVIGIMTKNQTNLMGRKLSTNIDNKNKGKIGNVYKDEITREVFSSFSSMEGRDNGYGEFLENATTAVPTAGDGGYPGDTEQKTWEEYIKYMSTENVYADVPVISGMSFFLKRKIYIIDMDEYANNIIFDPIMFYNNLGQRLIKSATDKIQIGGVTYDWPKNKPIVIIRSGLHYNRTEQVNEEYIDNFNVEKLLNAINNNDNKDEIYHKINNKLLEAAYKSVEGFGFQFTKEEIRKIILQETLKENNNINIQKIRNSLLNNSIEKGKLYLKTKGKPKGKPKGNTITLDLGKPLITSNKCYGLKEHPSGGWCAKFIGPCNGGKRGGGKSKKRKKISRRKMKRKRKQSKRRKKNRKTKKLI